MRARRRAHPHAVTRQNRKIDQTGGGQGRDVKRQQFVEQGAMRGAKVGQRVIIDADETR